MKINQTKLTWGFTVGFSVLLLLPIFFMVQAERPWIKSTHLVTTRVPASREIIITPTQTVGQSFIAPSDNLARIDVIIRRPKNPAAEYILTVRALGNQEPAQGEIIREGIFKVKKIQEIGRFYFEPIKDAQGKRFYFSLAPAENTVDTAGLFVSATELEGGDFYLNHEKQLGDLIFQVHGREEISLGEFGKEFFSRLNQDKPWFLRTPLLYVYGILFLGLLVWLIYFLLQKMVFTSSKKLVLKSVILGGSWLLILIIYLYIQTQVAVVTLVGSF